MNTISPTDDDAVTCLRAFLMAALPSGTAVFMGAITGNTLTVSNLVGSLALGDAVLGEKVAPNTVVSGIGAPGQYSITPAQSVPLTRMSSGVEIIAGQDNRVPEPICADFVVMTLTLVNRLATNIDTDADCTFMGSISGQTMTVGAPLVGSVTVGAAISGAGVADGTSVRQDLTGNGGLGNYAVSPSQTVAAVRMAAGTKVMLQEAQLTIQLDVHGPNSANHSQIITTLMRDEFAAATFAGINTAVAPLYANDPRQMPFINAESQYENRWIVEVALQLSQRVAVTQQYADAVAVGLTPVDSFYPVN